MSKTEHSMANTASRVVRKKLKLDENEPLSKNQAKGIGNVPIQGNIQNGTPISGRNLSMKEQGAIQSNMAFPSSNESKKDNKTPSKKVIVPSYTGSNAELLAKAKAAEKSAPTIGDGKNGRSFMLLAMGKPLFGRFAYNLALSIKLNKSCEGIPIVLYYSHDAIKELNEKQKRVFDKIIKIDESITHYQGKFMPFRAKLMANKLMPTEEVIFMDVDSIVFPDVDLARYFDMYQGCYWHPCINAVNPIDTINENTKLHIWTNLMPIINQLGINNDIYTLSSYFQYMKKGPELDKLFETAIEIHDGIVQGQLEADSVFYRYQIADEPIFSLAASKVGYKPLYTPHLQMMLPQSSDNYSTLEKKMKEKFIGITLPGNTPYTWFINYYNNSVKKNNMRYGIYSHFLWDRQKAFDRLESVK